MATETHEKEEFRGSCYVCDQELDVNDVVWAVQHYIEEHPTSDRTLEAVGLLTTDVECEGCGTLFTSDVSQGEGELVADAYCDECTEKEPLNRLVVTSVPTEGCV